MGIFAGAASDLGKSNSMSARSADRTAPDPVRIIKGSKREAQAELTQVDRTACRPALMSIQQRPSISEFWIDGSAIGPPLTFSRKTLRTLFRTASHSRSS